MKNPSDPQDALEALQRKLAGFGETSVRKTYYPELQERLEELERLKAFLDHSNDAIFLVEALTGRIVDLNDSASRQMGWSRAELLEKSLFEVSDLEEVPAAESLIRSAEQGDEVRDLIVTDLHTKEGGRFCAEITLNRMHFRDRAYVLAVARDITLRRELEEKLLQSQKMEAVGQLAGGVAHDFNNILMVIMGYGSMLTNDQALSPRHREQVGRIMDAADKAAQLTSGLLTFSRKQVIKTRTADLNDVIRHVEKFLSRIIGEDVQLKGVLARHPLPVEIDSNQIEQVLVNLATNARDAMPHGGLLTVETSLQRVDKGFVQANGIGAPGSYAVISVSDTGTGMDDATRRKIFEPFFTTKDPGKGTGLGMAIVYGIIKQHSGFINVYSEPGLGTTFRIYLPLSVAAPLTEEALRDLEQPPGGTETILVVEDEADLRTLLEQILSGAGYRVIVAEDGAVAVERFARVPGEVGLVLMDMVMPGMSGKEACSAIRKLDPSARVLYTSGYTMDIIRSRDLVEEGTELLMKPVRPMELLRKVREMLDR